MGKLLVAQSAVLLVGVVVAWSSVYGQVTGFIARYGTLFRFHDCAIPNPLLTACLYGAIAMLLAFFLSVSLVTTCSERRARWLHGLLLVGTCFAASVVAYEFLTYYRVVRLSSAVVSCSPGVFPLRTPCFTGLVVFFLAWRISWWRKIWYTAPTYSQPQSNT